MKWCDCGEPKDPLAEACERCAFLDGSTVQTTRIIDALRFIAEPTGIEQIASVTETTPRCVLRTIGPLIANGRVIREEGSRSVPALYRLAEREFVKAAKKQGELKGFERESIEELDDAFAELIEAREREKEWTDRRKIREANFRLKMLRYEEKLRKDKEQRSVYVYFDGEKEWPGYVKRDEQIYMGRPRVAGAE